MVKRLFSFPSSENAARDEEDAMWERFSVSSSGEVAGPRERTLKEVLLSARDSAIEADEVMARNGREASKDLVQAVTKMNPEFRRLDGILTGLAEACLNPVKGGNVQVIGVCSAQKGEGKTTVSLGLATALARRAGSEVLLVEADLASPVLADDLNDESVEGLTDCLGVEETLERAIRPTPVGHLAIMTAGQAAREPFSVLDGGGLRSLLRLLRERFRYIVLDMPAILEREESGRLVELVDGVVMVIQAGRSSKEVTEAGIGAIGQDRLLGVVLNRAASSAPGWVSKILATEQRHSD